MLNDGNRRYLTGIVMLMQNLRDKVVVVTGASAGIGRAIAVAFAREGAHVAALARDQNRLNSLCRQIKNSSPVNSLALPADVADSEQVEIAAERVEKLLGPIDIWVNNAMVTVFSPFIDMTAEEFRRVTEVTYLGTVYGTQAALKRMRPRNQGHIVQIGSALAYQAIPLQSAYCGAKHAIRGFTNAVRTELIHDNVDITISMIQLGAFNTPQFEWARTRFKYHPQPLPPIFQPELAATATVEAVKRRRREVWVGFSSMKAIIGGKLLPRLLERVLAKKAYQGQCTDEILDQPREGNLFNTVQGDYGIYGRFGKKSHGSSLQLWLSLHKTPVITGTVVVIIGVIIVLAFGVS